MATITQPPVTVSSTTSPQVKTLEDMQQCYRSRFAMAKKLGLEEWFVTAFGAEDQWMSQFTIMPYDKEANKF